MRTLRNLVLATLLTATASPLLAQEISPEAARRVESLQAVPSEITVEVGESVPVEIVALDAEGSEVEGVQFRLFSRGLRIDSDGVTGVTGGTEVLVATLVMPPDWQGDVPMVRVPVTVTWPEVTAVEAEPLGEDRLYAGTTVRYRATAFHEDGSERPGADVSWSTSDPAVATVDERGFVTAHEAGDVTLVASFEGVRSETRLAVPTLPARSLEIRGGSDVARQGDVLTFEAVATDEAGRTVDDIPVVWSSHFEPDDSINAPGASGLVDDGSFVGEEPGRYTVMASAGDLAASTAVTVRPREVVREVEIMGQGSVSHVHTSDLWVFEGVDGRDYAVTGTWGGDGWTYFWDVTDPSSPVKTDSLQVDARTVNDVKVSPDGRYAALSREGASSRRNGVVIMDLSDPAHPTIASTYTEGLTGGVHNMFATDDHLFALSAGDKYVILDVTDIYEPTYVSEYNHPDSRIHDVWVHDGIAYSSEWGKGVVIVDVGNGKWGGTIEEPVFVTNVPYPVGRTHAAFPYYQEETGKHYLFLGDEIMHRRGAAWSGAGLGRIPEKGGTPSVTSGYIHIIDFTDPENPKDVARYEVPEFGTHNLWVEDDVLYVAYYEGGVRVVDVSGELMGNLADQDREIAVFKAFDPDGYAPNAPMAWGPQPYKGHLFFSDFNSGLWSVKLMPSGPPIS